MSTSTEQDGLASICKQILLSPDRAETRQRLLGLIGTAFCLFTFMFVAAVSTGVPTSEAPRVGALNVLIWALIRSVPLTLIAGVTTLVVTAIRYRKQQRQQSAD